MAHDLFTQGTRRVGVAAGMLDDTLRHYEDQAAELCARAGITSDDLRMRLDRCAAKSQRIRVWREIEREGLRR